VNVEDPRHGTTAGHLAHRHAGEPACAACVAAKTRYEKARNLYGPRMVPAVGTRRRIQALKAMGHSGADIAARLGVSYQAVHKLEHGTAAKVFAATADRVAATYEQMSMTLPTGYHRTRIRNKSTARGYVPPLTWDDIDDPDEQPTRGTYRPVVKRDAAEMAAELDHLLGLGVSIHMAAKQLGVSIAAIEKATERAKGSAA